MSQGIRLSDLDTEFNPDLAAYQQRRQGVLSLAIVPQGFADHASFLLRNPVWKQL